VKRKIFFGTKKYKVIFVETILLYFAVFFICNRLPFFKILTKSSKGAYKLRMIWLSVHECVRIARKTYLERLIEAIRIVYYYQFELLFQISQM